MRKFLKSLNQELQNGLAPQQPGGYGGSGGFGGFGGYGGGGIGGLLNSFVQQPQPTNVPCPRKVPQAGFPDWFGLTDPRFQYFNVCPSCYHSQIRPTPYAGAFAQKPPAPPHLALRCDMSRFWVKMAGLVLMTMNQDRRHDPALLARVSGITVQDGLCPNAQLQGENFPPPRVSRVWYTFRDPATGVTPLPGWTVCSHCVVNMQTLCPTISNAWVPVSQTPIEGSCAFVPSDRFDDQYTSQQLQYAATCVVVSAQAGRTDMSPLVNWLRENPPPARGGAPGRPWQAPSGPCPQNYPSITLRCYVMRDLFDLTVCEKCFTEVIKPDQDRGVELAKRFDTAPATMPSGFTCQVYSPRMRQVWAQAASTGDLAFLGHKASVHRCQEDGSQSSARELPLTFATGPRAPLQRDGAATEGNPARATGQAAARASRRAGTLSRQRHARRSQPGQHCHDGQHRRRRASDRRLHGGIPEL